MLNHGLAIGKKVACWIEEDDKSSNLPRQAADTPNFRLHLIIFLEENVTTWRQINSGEVRLCLLLAIRTTCVESAEVCTLSYLRFDNGESDGDGDVRLT